MKNLVESAFTSAIIAVFVTSIYTLMLAAQELFSSGNLPSNLIVDTIEFGIVIWLVLFFLILELANALARANQPPPYRRRNM